jgi:hypothetical protein
VIVKLVVQLKLLPTPVQAAAHEATLPACNEAATWVSETAFERGEFKNFALRKQVYGAVKSRWNLGAQAGQHVIKKTCDAYATLKTNLKTGNLGRPGSRRYRKAAEKPIAFRPQGAQPYDDRMLSWQIPDRTVSIWTVAGRVKNVAFTASPDQLATLALYRDPGGDRAAAPGTCRTAPLRPPGRAPRRSTYNSAAHPRLRGEDPEELEADLLQHGSPPLARGGPRRGLTLGVLPAQAGVSRPRPWSTAQSRRPPRTGDRGPDQRVAHRIVGRHVYLPTGCLHGDDGYCQGMTRLNGANATCKHCGAKCLCGCHEG